VATFLSIAAEIEMLQNRFNLIILSWGRFD